ncbi:MAG TPA: hypothetical protein VLH09_10700 [Bryobacteraceae bacterium]|nr:hypothetical protein [Bryobacteraceae bacterium]
MPTTRQERRSRVWCNLVRNLGGGIGISLATTFIARGAQAHRALLIPHLTPYDFAYQQRLAAEL